MRRYALYIAAGTTAFVFGLAVSKGFISTKNTEDTPNATRKIEPLQVPVKEFTCADEAVEPVWEQLIKDDPEWTGYIFNESPVKDCRELFEKLDVELNNDGLAETVLQGKGTLCGSGGDCRTWILSKINQRYEIILHLYAAEAFDDLKVLPEITYKFRNLKIKANHHRWADSYGVFKFDG